MATTKRVYFRIQAPEAEEVAVTGSFNGWQTLRPLKKGKTGLWQTWMNLAPGGYEYRFLVDGHWTNDPKCQRRAPNPYGAENDVLSV